MAKNNSEPAKDDAVSDQYNSDFDFEEYIPFRLVRTQLWMHRVLRPEATPTVRRVANISKNESRVILVAALLPSITPSEISDKLGLDPAIVTRTIAMLVSKDLVTTRARVSDQRSKSIHPTERGKLLCDELIAVMQRFDEHLKGLLNDSELSQLSQILDKLLEGSRSFSDS